MTIHFLQGYYFERSRLTNGNALFLKLEKNSLLLKYSYRLLEGACTLFFVAALLLSLQALFARLSFDIFACSKNRLYV